MAHDELGDRMKKYEEVPKHRLVSRMPVILRLDGKAFHTLTRGMDKPWDEKFQWCMWDTAIELCKAIQGVRIAYVQSDEISLLLVDYQTLQSQGWFDYEVQKMVSVSAGVASVEFNRWFPNRFPHKASARPVFDSRCFNLPKEEVTNYFVWRQQDATRNAITMAAQAKFSHAELHGVSSAMKQEMLFQQHGINFNDYPTAQKRGVCIVKLTESFPTRTSGDKSLELTERSRWVVDKEIPIFTQKRDFIEQYIAPEIE